VERTADSLFLQLQVLYLISEISVVEFWRLGIHILKAVVFCIV